MIPIVVLASGRGSNFEAIHQAVLEGRLEAEIRAVISDQADAPILAKARQRGLKALCIETGGGSREEHERRILAALRDFDPRFLVMAGYMRVITPTLIEAFRSEDAGAYARIVNVHPSLLPAFPGLGAYRQAFEHGAQVAGVSVHLVDAVVDGGPICAQEAFSIADCRSAEQVEQRGLAVEHRLFPETLRWVLPEAFSVEGRRVCVRAD